MPAVGDVRDFFTGFWDRPWRILGHDRFHDGFLYCQRKVDLLVVRFGIQMTRAGTRGGWEGEGEGERQIPGIFEQAQGSS